MYIEPEIAYQKLLDYGDYTSDTIPSLSLIRDYLLFIEKRVDEWMGWHPALTVYTQVLETEWNGNILLPYYPVVKVTELTSLIVHLYPTAEDEQKPFAYYWRDRTIVTGIRGVKAKFQVTYHAGYDPLPEIFGLTIFNILREALKQEGVGIDLGFLDDPMRDISSLGLPGGLSKGWQNGKITDRFGKETGGSKLDRLLYPLLRYRRKLLLK